MSDRVTIGWSALRRVERKEAHSPLSGLLPLRRISGVRSVWLGGMFLAATIAVLNPYYNHARALDEDVSHPAIKVSLHDGLLTLRARDAPLAEILSRIGEAAGFRTVVARASDVPAGWSFTDVPLQEALRQLLARRSYVMLYDEPQSQGERGRLAELRVLRDNREGLLLGDTMMERGPDIAFDKALGATPKLAGQDAPSIATVDDDYDTRLLFVRSMTRHPNGAAVPGLSALLSQDEDPTIRRIAAIGLGKTNGEAALEALTKAIGDKDASVRIRAIQGLGKKKDDRAVDALSEVLLADPDSRMRRAAARSLAMMRTQEAFEALRNGEYDPDYYVRRDAALALARLQ